MNIINAITVRSNLSGGTGSSVQSVKMWIYANNASTCDCSNLTLNKVTNRLNNSLIKFKMAKRKQPKLMSTRLYASSIASIV